MEGAELEAFWNEMERVAVGVEEDEAVDFGSSAGEAATATLTSVSKAALLLLCCVRDAIMDLSAEVLPGIPAGEHPSLGRE